MEKFAYLTIIFNIFGKNFLKSIDQAEKEIRQGKIKKDPFFFRSVEAINKCIE